MWFGTYKGISIWDGEISTIEFDGKSVGWKISDILCARYSTNYYSGDNGLLIEKDGNVI